MHVEHGDEEWLGITLLQASNNQRNRIRLLMLFLLIISLHHISFHILYGIWALSTAAKNRLKISRRAWKFKHFECSEVLLIDWYLFQFLNF